MSAKLLSSDYDSFIFEAFKLQESDFYNYYLNIVNEHYESNNDIIKGLSSSIEKWTEWYRGQRGHRMAWEVDSDGKKQLMDPDKTSIPLDNHFGIRRHIDKYYFDRQIEQIEIINKIVNLYFSQKKCEEILTPDLLENLNNASVFPSTFDLDKLKARFEAFKTLSLDVQPGKKLHLKEPFLSQKKIGELAIHTGKIWNCPDLATLEKVFDFNNSNIEEFSIKLNQKENFYNLLRNLWNEAQLQSTTQQELIKPFLERYNLSWNTFNKGITLKI